MVKMRCNFSTHVVKVLAIFFFMSKIKIGKAGRIMFIDYENRQIIIVDNFLTPRLKEECEKLFTDCKKIGFKERINKFGLLSKLVNDLLENKNKNHSKFINELRSSPETSQLILDGFELITIYDYETELYLSRIFKLMSQKE